MGEDDFHLLGESPYLITVNAVTGELMAARELGSSEATDPARYAANEARDTGTPIICIVVEDGRATSARCEVQQKNAPKVGGVF